MKDYFSFIFENEQLEAQIIEIIIIITCRVQNCERRACGDSAGAGGGLKADKADMML